MVKCTMRAEQRDEGRAAHYLGVMGIPTLTLAQAATSGTTLAMLSEVATVVIAVAMLILVLVTLSIFLRLNRLLDEMKGVAKDNIGPVSDRAKIISDNVEFITQALRTDVERLNSSVRALSDRLNQASERMEERIEDFNALMEVVQGEAEDIFLDTASTVRGVRAGASRIASPRNAAPAPPETRARGSEHVDEDDPGAEAPDEGSRAGGTGGEDEPTSSVGSPADAGV
jgi:methyl-accepting chemotaxis protein